MNQATIHFSDGSTLTVNEKTVFSLLGPSGDIKEPTLSWSNCSDQTSAGIAVSVAYNLAGSTFFTVNGEPRHVYSTSAVLKVTEP